MKRDDIDEALDDYFETFDCEIRRQDFLTFVMLAVAIFLIWMLTW